MSPLHSFSVDYATQMLPSSNVSQSPTLRCGRLAARTGSYELTVAHQHLLLMLEISCELFGQID